MEEHDGIPYRRRTPEEIGELLREYERSGLTQRAFAKRIGVSRRNLCRWLGKTRNGGAGDPEELHHEKSRLVPVSIRSTASSPASPFELVTPRGLTLRIPVDFDPAALERLLALLERC